MLIIENGPVEIVDLPIENGGSFHSFLYVYQRLKKLVFFPNSPTHPNSSAASGEQVVPDVVPVWVLGWLRLRLDSCSLAAVTLSYHLYCWGYHLGFSKQEWEFP